MFILNNNKAQAMRKNRSSIKLIRTLNESVSRNIEATIAKGKELCEKYNFEWQLDRWNVTALFKKLKQPHNSTHNQYWKFGPIIERSVARDSCYTELLKAISIIYFDRHQTQADSTQNFINVGRKLFDICTIEKTRIEEISNKEIEKIQDYINQSTSAESRKHGISTLNIWVDIINKNKLSICRITKIARPLEKKIANPTPIRFDNEVKSSKKDKRTSRETFIALGQLYQSIPKSNIADALLVRFHIVMALTGRRIGEILSLPLQDLACDQNGTYHLTYYPEKIKYGLKVRTKKMLYLIPQTVPFMKAILSEILELTRQSRDYAQRIEDQDYEFELPPGISFSSSQLAEWLNTSPALAKQWAIQKKIPVRRLKDNEAYLRSDLLNYLRKKTEKYRNLPDEHKVSKQLFILPINAYHNKKQTFFYEIKMVTASQVRLLLHDRGEFISARSRAYGIYVSDEFTKNPHSFRHFLNDALDRGGVTELQQTEYFNRKTVNQTRVYQHRDANQINQESYLTISKLSNNKCEANESRPEWNKRDAIALAASVPVLIQGFGFCSHQWEQAPCPKFINDIAPIEKMSWMNTKESIKNELDFQLNFNRGMLDMAFARKGLSKYTDKWITLFYLRISLIQDAKKRYQNE